MEREYNKTVGRKVRVLYKDSEAYAEYQLYLKQYIFDVTQFNLDIEKKLAYY